MAENNPWQRFNEGDKIKEAERSIPEIGIRWTAETIWKIIDMIEPLIALKKKFRFVMEYDPERESRTKFRIDVL